jgi:hypothetical protein
MAAANSTFSTPQSDRPSGVQSGTPAHATLWENLKLAISESSGFKRWQVERQPESGALSGAAVTTLDQSLDDLVHRYLRDTLETLAY